MNLQSELQRIAVKYEVKSQEKFRNELTDITMKAVADLIEISKAKAGMDQTIKSVANAFGLIPEMLFMQSNQQKYVIPRQMAHYMLYAQGYGFSEIARVFGQHHTTVLYSTKKMHKAIKNGYYSKEYQETMDNVRNCFLVDNGQPAPEDCEL